MPLFITTWPDADIAALEYSCVRGEEKAKAIRVRVHGHSYYFKSNIPVDIPQSSYGRFVKRLNLIPDRVIRELIPGVVEDERVLMDWRMKTLGMEAPKPIEVIKEVEVIVEKVVEKRVEVEVLKFHLPPKGVLAKCTKPSLIEYAEGLGLDTEGTTADLLERLETQRAA